jgi:hypothetical protein
MSNIAGVGQAGAAQELHSLEDTDAAPPKANGTGTGGSKVQAYAEGVDYVKYPPPAEASGSSSVQSDLNSSAQSMNFGFVLGKIFELLAGLFGGGGGGQNTVKNNPLDWLTDGTAPHKKKDTHHALKSVDEDDQKKTDGSAEKDPKAKGSSSTDDTSEVKTPNDTPPTDGPDDVDDSAGAGDVLDEQVGGDDSSMVA